MARVVARPERSASASAEVWTPEELELLLLTTAPPTTQEVFRKADNSTTDSSSSRRSEEGDPLAMDVSKSDEGELDAATRRTRRTEIERLSRRRRQSSLRAMRDEVRGLETKFAGLMEGHATRKRIAGLTPASPLGSDGTTSLDDDGNDDASRSEIKFNDQMQRLRERFIELKLHESELENDKKELQHTLRDKQLLAMSIQAVAFSSVRAWSDPEQPPPSSDLEFKFQSADEYDCLMRGVCEELQTLEATMKFESLGSNCMGWSDRRAELESHIVFSLTKTFVGRDAEPILLESWDVFSSEARLRQSFGSWGIHVQLRVIDRPRDDIVVIHRSNIRSGCKSKGERRMHVVFLLFRIRTADGFTLCMRSIPSLQTDLEPPEQWTGIFTWIHFREFTSSDGTKNCEVVYNNYMPYRRRRPLSDLFVAFLSTVVRWETACVASRLLTTVP